MTLCVYTIDVHSYIGVTHFFPCCDFYNVISLLVACYELFKVTSSQSYVYKNKQQKSLSSLADTAQQYRPFYLFIYLFIRLNILIGSVFYWIICLFSPNQAGRLLLRRFVCEKIGVPWSEIRLERSPRGKPYLASPNKVPSHSCRHSVWQLLLLYLNYMWRLYLIASHPF